MLTPMADDSPFDPGSDLIRGAAMVLAQLCRRSLSDSARAVAEDFNLTYDACVRAGVDEADLQELRDLFGVAPPENVIPLRR